jgi:drug/metabolite transporter (DMT)-like permease
LGPVAAGALRTGGAATFLLPVLSARRAAEPQRPDFGNVASLIVAGIVAIGIGGLLYIAAVQEAGAGRTAILTSTMPLFTLPLAVVFLRERVTPRVVAGTITCIAGIWLIV